MIKLLTKKKKEKKFGHADTHTETVPREYEDGYL